MFTFHSRSRQSARLLNNPWAQPPSASDWVVQPTHPRHDPVPYYLAPLWDAHFAHREQSRTTRSLRNADNNSERARISKEVRKRLKHARAARGLLQDLEEGVRRFIQSWNEKQQKLQNKDEQGPSSDDDVDSEDEVVFVGRNAEKRDRLPQRQLNGSSASGERDGEMMVFESPAHDRGGVFGYVLPSRLRGDTNRLTCHSSLQALAGALHCIILWTVYMVCHPRQPGPSGGLCWFPSAVGSGARRSNIIPSRPYGEVPNRRCRQSQGIFAEAAVGSTVNGGSRLREGTRRCSPRN